MDSKAYFISDNSMHKFWKIDTFTIAGMKSYKPSSALPCKILFPFLLQAYEYAKHQYLCKNSWTQAITRIHLWTCCMSSEVTDKLFIMANEVKQNQASKSIVTPPELWLQHKKLGNKIKQFTDALKHMLFLGVTTHL